MTFKPTSIQEPALTVTQLQTSNVIKKKQKKLWDRMETSQEEESMPQDVFLRERMCKVQSSQHRGSASIRGRYDALQSEERVQGTGADDIGVTDQISSAALH